MKFLSAITGFFARLYCFAGSVAGNVVDIEDSEVPQTAAAHCNIHWSILYVIAIYGFYAVLRAAYIKRAFWSGDNSSDTPELTAGRHHGFNHLDSIVGIIAVLVICLSKRYWICTVDYKVAVAGVLIIIISTIMLEILNYKLCHRETC